MQYCIRPIGDSRLAIDLANVVFDRADGKKQRLSDFRLLFPASADG